jgi:hypothetical protein
MLRPISSALDCLWRQHHGHRFEARKLQGTA